MLPQHIIALTCLANFSVHSCAMACALLLLPLDTLISLMGIARTLRTKSAAAFWLPEWVAMHLPAVICRLHGRAAPCQQIKPANCRCACINDSIHPARMLTEICQNLVDMHGSTRNTVCSGWHTANRAIHVLERKSVSCSIAVGDRDSKTPDNPDRGQLTLQSSRTGCGCLECITVLKITS